MSAIAGMVGFDGAPAERAAIERMLGSMARRAPDGAAHLLGKNFALGHGALHTVPAPLRGAQPLRSDDQRLHLVMDGRIDNRDLVRRDLLAGGARLRDDSDAELVLCAYQHFGRECPSKLIGEYAFCIWDDRQQSLFGARDAVGTRHFYY